MREALKPDPYLKILKIWVSRTYEIPNADEREQRPLVSANRPSSDPNEHQQDRKL